MLTRYLRALGPAVLLLLGGAYALASFNWCSAEEPSPAQVLEVTLGRGAIRVGASKAPLLPPLPVVVAGHPPWRSEATSLAQPLFARAVVVETGSTRVGVVSLELVTVTDGIVQKLREVAEAQGVTGLWVSCTHTHSSFGGYDPRFVSELAGTGRYRAEAEGAVVRAASEALTQAVGTLSPATFEVGEDEAPELVATRGAGEKATGSLTRAVFRGGDGQVKAEWTVFAAHPTAVPKRTTALDGDWPGFFSRAREASGVGVSVLLQGAVGNASMGPSDGEGSARAEDFAKRLERRVGLLDVGHMESQTQVGLARVSVALPEVDASRLVPKLFVGPGNNLLCRSSAKRAELSLLRLGPLSLLAVPGEPTAGAAEALATVVSGARVVGVTNGYLGYVETRPLVETGQGEAKRQYFKPELLERLTGGAAVLKALLAGGEPR